MDHYRQQNVVVVFVVPLVYILAANLTISLLIARSDCRYLRPSDHGLEYQNNSSHPTKGDAPEMISFFNGGQSIPLPVDKNTTSSAVSGGLAGSAWWSSIERRRSHEAHKNRVREILLITSLVCGLTGVVLLVVWALLFLLRRLRVSQQRQRRPQQLGAGWSKDELCLSTPDSTSALPNGVQIK